MQTKILLENQKPATGLSAAFWIVLITLFLTVVSTVYADGPVLPGQSSAGGAVATAPLATGTAPAGVPQQSPFGMMMPILIMFGVVYFMMIRPQQKKAKAQQVMIGALSDGDQVVTSSGILGKITGIAEKVVTLEIADDVRIKILKSQVSQVVKGSIKDLA